MANHEKSTKSGFVIKLSSETVQKLSEDEQNKSKDLEDNVSRTSSETTGDDQSSSAVQEPTKEKQDDGILSTEQSGEGQSKSEAKSVAEEKCTSSDQSVINSWGDYAPYITYEDEEAIYTDPSTQQQYSWNKATSSWERREGQAGPPDAPTDHPARHYSYEDDTHIYTEPDGSKFFWDQDKKAWIPKVDDDFLAFYQMSYGFVDNTAKEEDKPKPVKKKDVEKTAEQIAGVKRKNEPQWFEPSEETNTKVYVSNLPHELTEQEFVDLMQKCGLVERDPFTQKMKVKLYYDKDNNNVFKGDALCTYIKIESVDLALKLLDGSDFKGNKIKVERAHFQLKGEYNPSLKPKKKKKKELEKLKKMQQKLFDWRPEKFIGERSKHERVVIVKNLFHPSDFDQEVQLILDYQQDLREECGKCGDVRKVVIYDRHPEGVAQVTMKEPEQADAVVALINGRWFGKKQITAEIWDGRTKYKIGETDADINKRIDKWENFLEGKEEKAEAPETSTSEPTTGTSDSNITEHDTKDPDIKEPDIKDQTIAS